MVGNLFVIVPVILLSVFLFHRRLLASPIWRAMVTPLASIIGSGFLVLAPILVRHFGSAAVLVMAGLCFVAYAIGGAIRWNIAAIGGEHGLMPFAGFEIGLEKLSLWTLAFAYIISVCYYLNLFGAFCTSLTAYNAPVYGRLVTTVVLGVIGFLGWTRGLYGLEKAEQWSVGIKLAVIGGLLAGMFYHAGVLTRHGLLPHNHATFHWSSLRVASGLLITVQGFETSRYLKEGHNAVTRIATMRYAQWFSTLIYLVFIGLASISFLPGAIGARETAIIQMTEKVAPVLPVLLVLAALAAQFSAAVADTGGCGGLTYEMSGERLHPRLGYVVIMAAAAALTWMADIYQIISYASRAFAVYYGLQCAVAALLARRAHKQARSAWFALLTVTCFSIAIFGVPAE